jgi:hypothetical protein
MRASTRPKAPTSPHPSAPVRNSPGRTRDFANGATLDTLLAVMNTVELTKTRADELESLLMQ